jgi:hypothetical protein
MTLQKLKGKSDCCNGELIQWFGDVTKVMLGATTPKPVLRCMSCGKPAKKNK